MTTFTVGEEVLYEGERFVVSERSAEPPYRYRLLATTPRGARMVWARHEQLDKMRAYTRPIDDTDRI